MFTEYTILQKIHSDIEEDLALNAFKYHHFRQAWYSFLGLLDIEYSQGFCCNACGVTPSTVIMDGTTISFRRALDSWHSFVGATPPANGKSGR